MCEWLADDTPRSVAWKVDFNLALTSFRPNVVGVRKLIDLALASPFEQPPKMVFISSISVTQSKHPQGKHHFALS